MNENANSDLLSNSDNVMRNQAIYSNHLPSSNISRRDARTNLFEDSPEIKKTNKMQNKSSKSSEFAINHVIKSIKVNGRQSTIAKKSELGRLSSHMDDIVKK